MRRADGRMGGWADAATGVLCLVITTGMVIPCRLLAQGPVDPPIRPSATVTLEQPRIPPVIHYGKWAALGSSIYLGVVSQRRHADADDAYAALQRACDATPTACNLVNGHYADPAQERLYQDTRRLDHEATRYLIGAETLFAAAAAGFIWELVDHSPRPKNIPLHPLIEPTPSATRVSLTITF